VKTFKGILLIFGILGLTLLIWILATPSIEIIPLDRLSHILAGLSLSGLFLVFILSTRNKRIETWFGGLQNVYVFHKYLAIFSVALIFIHGRLSESVAEISNGGEKTLSAAFGSFGQILFIVLVLIALFSKKMKYENWRIFHRLLIIPYALGVYHTYFSSRYNLFEFSPLSIWVGLTSLMGLSAGLYMLFFYQKAQFRYKGKITDIKRVSASSIEIAIKLETTLVYQSGQYVFLKIFQKGIEKAPHPFSISGGDGSIIYLTIKGLGDYTKQLYSELKEGTAISLDGPYGHLDFEKGRDKQLWIAGGIGITPFISYLKKHTADKTITLFYSFRGEEEAVYKDFLEKYQKDNPRFSVHFVDTAKSDRLHFDGFELEAGTDVYICGPEKMIKQHSRYFKRHFKNARIFYEGFKFK